MYLHLTKEKIFVEMFNHLENLCDNLESKYNLGWKEGQITLETENLLFYFEQSMLGTSFDYFIIDGDGITESESELPTSELSNLKLTLQAILNASSIDC